MNFLCKDVEILVEKTHAQWRACSERRAPGDRWLKWLKYNLLLQITDRSSLLNFFAGGLGRFKCSCSSFIIIVKFSITQIKFNWSFSKNFKNNNHNLIKTYKLFYFCNVQLYNALYNADWNKFLKLEKLVRNICIKLRTCILVGLRVRECWPMLNFQSEILSACEWENLIVADVKLIATHYTKLV